VMILALIDFMEKLIWEQTTILKKKSDVFLENYVHS
jgi:hypothetical protein